MALCKPADNVIPFFPNAEQFLQTCLSQEFSLPIPLMKYVWTNPSSPEAYQKLIQCCKLFFIKTPILVIRSLIYDAYFGWEYCIGNKCKGVDCVHSHKEIDMHKIRNKIWLTKKFVSFAKIGTLSKNILNLIPKLYKCDLKTLELLNEILSYNELKFLSSGVKDCYLSGCLVQYDNGKKVSMENIVKIFNGCKNLSIEFDSDISYAPCENYDELVVACNTVARIDFSYLPQAFDITKFYQCLKVRATNRTFFYIFSDEYLDVRYTAVIYDILQIGSFDFVPPVMDVTIQSKSQLRQLKKIQKEAAKCL